MSRGSTTLVAALMAGVLAVTLAPGASGAEGHYFAPGGDVLVNCPPELLIDACLGGYVFDVEPSDSVEITIHDFFHQDNVGGYYFFSPESDGVFHVGVGTSLDSGPFCTSTTVDVPDEAGRLTVAVETAYAPYRCPHDFFSYGTSGTITADWISS